MTHRVCSSSPNCTEWGIPRALGGAFTETHPVFRILPNASFCPGMLSYTYKKQQFCFPFWLTALLWDKLLWQSYAQHTMWFSLSLFKNTQFGASLSPTIYAVPFLAWGWLAPSFPVQKGRQYWWGFGWGKGEHSLQSLPWLEDKVAWCGLSHQGRGAKREEEPKEPRSPLDSTLLEYQ